MPDIALVNPAITSAPKDYKIPGSSELLLKAVTANVDGTSAGGTFLPALQLLDPAGNVMWTSVNTSLPVAVGGTANVSWFPGGGIDNAGSTPTASGITKLTSPLGTLSVLNPTGPNTNIDMPTTGVSAGTYGDASHSAAITVDAEGRLTSASQVGIAGGSSTIGFEIGYDQITANVNVASTTEATGTTILTASAHTFDGAAVLCEFFSPLVRTGSNASQVIVCLFEGSTEITRLGLVTNQTGGGVLVGAPMTAHYRFTPTAASHTYKVTAFATDVTGTPVVAAGAAGTANASPAFLRFTKV